FRSVVIFAAAEIPIVTDPGQGICAVDFEGMANERGASESDGGEKRQRENCCEQKTLRGAVDNFHLILLQKNLRSVRKTDSGVRLLTRLFEHDLFCLKSLLVRWHGA